ncbi:T9SS type A sorting domain-containing protein [Crocinitomix catalasitica]|uniref:T9SS type A sorting domain-containing protein n=1 Tax=Crocinitomix catalasitica TaxID=184607 RepID=UPI0004832395|nr:T9SS type A sorting domain-containing protein [Crocinitomix catalasitica]
MLKLIIGSLCIITTFQTTFAQFGFEYNTETQVIKDDITQKFPWAGGMDYCQFSNIDLNFDGVNDLFVFDRTCNKILTFVQNGGPGENDFQYAPEYESDFPDNLHDWALLVDYNCDGLMDIFSYNIGGTSLYKNVGNVIDGNSFEIEVELLQTYIYDGYAYMYLSSQDIPALVDVDGDGDIDILGFGVLGTAVEYHKNLSVETYGVCDSILYETKNICWGRFREDSGSNDIELWDTLDYPCDEESLGLEFARNYGRATDHQDRHSGSTLLALDMDDSGVLDLVLGDISYKNLTLLMNTGEEVNTNSGMGSVDPAFPSSSIAVDMPIFPAGYHVDVNNDNIRDLIVSPNAKIASVNKESVWLYENEGADTEPDFQHRTENFLQSEMIDIGTGALPIFFDHNGDGLLDLLVSSQGEYNPISGGQISRISYYENTGTETEPEFTFITEDYQDLSTMGIGATLFFYPAFGDLDNDGDEDMILGEYTGYCYYLENTGGAGNPAIFNTFITLNDATGSPVFSGTYAYPNLTDLDRDGDLDLVIGRRTGKLQYLENTGSISDYAFTNTNPNLGDVNVSGEGFIEGHAIPQFIEIGGEYHLIVGSKLGFLYYYDNIEDNLTGEFNLVDMHIDYINIGTYAAPAIANLNGDDRFEMVLGNRRGGVGFFESAPISVVGIAAHDNLVDVKIYPNPTKQAVTMDLGSLTYAQLKSTSIELIDLSGRSLLRVKPNSNLVSVDLNNVAKGTYLVKITDQNSIFTEKLIVY